MSPALRVGARAELALLSPRHLATARVAHGRSPGEDSLGLGTGAIGLPLGAWPRRTSELPPGALSVTARGTGGGRSERAAARWLGLCFSKVGALCGGTLAWQPHAATGQ